MNCDDVRPLLDAYSDNELDLMTSLSIEGHLQTCGNCQPIYNNRLVLRSNLNNDPLYFHPPPAFERRLRASLRKVDQTANPFHMFMEQFRGRWMPVSVIVGILVVAIIVFNPFHSEVSSSTLPVVAQEVLASHIRSLMANHLTDVTSTDQHTVKPWFDGKLDFIPPVVDLAGQGFPLLGGRLDYLENAPVSALVYGSDKHFINVFIWPSTESAQESSPVTTIQGYHLIHWIQDQMNYWAISDVEASKLTTFVGWLRAQIG
jgi:anti-sigma factor RsiW